MSGKMSQDRLDEPVWVQPNGTPTRFLSAEDLNRRFEEAEVKHQEFIRKQRILTRYIAILIVFGFVIVMATIIYVIFSLFAAQGA